MTQPPPARGDVDDARGDTRPLTIGVLSPTAGGYFFGEVLSGVVAGVRAAGGGRVLLLQTLGAGWDSDAVYGGELSLPVGWDQVDALVSVAWATGPELLREARAAGIPVVLVSTEHAGVDAASVVVDNASGVNALVDHLVAHGHTAIGFVGYVGQSDVAERWVAYQEAMRARGLPPLPIVASPDEVETGGAAVARAVLAARPRWTAAVAGTDRIAVGLLQALQEAGADVPRDIAVVGFDDIEPGWYIDPPLTTVRQDFFQLGVTAARIAIDEARGHAVPHVRTNLTAPLVVRESCGCTPQRLALHTETRQAAAGLVAQIWALIAEDPPVHVADEELLGENPPRVRPLEAVDLGLLDDVIGAAFRRLVAGSPPPETIETFAQTCVRLLAGATPRMPATSPGRLTLRHTIGRITAMLSRELGHRARERVRAMAQAMNGQFDVGMTLLGRTLGGDPADLRWLAEANISVGLLGLWADDEHTTLRIAGARDTTGSGLASLVGRTVRLEEFPPAELLDLTAADDDTAAYAIPVRGSGADHGFLALVAPVDRESDAGRATYDHWAALLSAALREQHLLEDLRQSEERYALAARAAADGLWEWSASRRSVYLSDRTRELIGIDGEITHQAALLTFHPDDRQHVRESLNAAIDTPDVPTEVEARIVHRDGSVRWVVVRALGVRAADRGADRAEDDGDTGRVPGLVGSVSDIDQRRRLQEQLRQAALFDPVTGLPNRRLFLDRLRLAIGHARRHPGGGFAVLFLDLDGFKVVNDSLGHLQGDRLLTEIGERLRADLRSVDTAARFGGDEFAVLLMDPAAEDLLRIATRIQERIARPVRLGDQEVTVTASIGIATSHTPYDDPEDVLRDADIAMYRAKEAERGTACIFDPAMHEQALERLRTRTALTQAIENGEIVVHYQPVVDLARPTVTEFEALVRWEHPERGLLEPAAFLPHLENTHAVVQLGQEVLDQVCAQLAQWRRAHPDVVVAVNLSQREFWSSGLVTTVLETLARHDVPGSALVLETTEAVLERDTDGALVIARELERAGVRLRLDDFGTGHSSVTTLRTFPIDALKVDGTFVHEAAQDERAAALLAAVLALGRAVGVDVHAEWVETPAQAEVLRDLGCRAAQGWLYARPVPAAQAGALIGTDVAPAGWPDTPPRPLRTDPSGED